MIFIQNPEMENMIGVYSDNGEWFMACINTGEYEWSPTKFVIKNEKPLNEEYIISIHDVPKKLLYNIVSISFNFNKVENFEKILL